MENVFGARRLTAAESKGADLGALAQLPGIWVSAPPPTGSIALGWNVISVPGNPAFTFEVIPYIETLTFSAAVVEAGNRGPFVRGNQVDQQIIGLIYEQQIISACPGGAPCVARGFPAGAVIHEETGMFLNVKKPNGDFSIARMSTIPHGNALLALGNFSNVVPKNNNFFPVASAMPTNLSGTPVGIDAGLDYTQQITDRQFPSFNQANPNSALQETLGSQVITAMTTLQFSTSNKDAGGGILNLPFISQNVNATSMDATFWIETLKGHDALQMQYTQTINLVFPPTNSAVPIVWPHITVNTLVKKG
jgi:hypothetical protein